MGEQKTALRLLLVFSFACLAILINSTVKAEPKMIVVPDDFVTVQEAIDNAVAGDTIFVKNGVYNERLIIEKSIILVGENTKNTIIEGNRAQPVITVKHDDVSINSFKKGLVIGI